MIHCGQFVILYCRPPVAVSATTAMRKGEREVREGERGRSKWKRQDGARNFCKYLPTWHHVVCHVSIENSHGAFEISDDGSINMVQESKWKI